MAELKGDKIGVAVDIEGFKVVKKVAKAGDTIARHNHPGANITFTVVKGKVDVYVNDEKFEVVPGKLVVFDGENYINAEMIEDSEVFVTIVDK